MNAFLRAANRRAMIFLTVAALAGAATSQPSDKPMRVIVPLTTGSLVDSVARAMSNELSRVAGRPVVVENLPGAGGITGTAQLVRAPKDGLTVALVSSNHVINPSIYKTVPFDTLKDITPITVIGASTMVLAVNPSLPANNLKELIELARKKPGQLNIASSGNGTTLHLAGELLNIQAGMNTRHIPYKGQAPQMTDIMGGQVDMGFLAVATATPQIQAGKLRAVGVSSTTRSFVLPDVPTLAEAGLPDFNLDSWVAVVAPGNLPKEIVAQLQQTFQTVVASPEVKKNFAALGVSPRDTSPEATRAFFQKEYELYGSIIKKVGIQAD